MKNLKSLLLLAFTVLTVNAFGQAQHEGKNNHVFIDAKGGIHDHGGTKLGYITKDDIVKNNKGKTVYFIDRERNVVDAKGKKLGKANKDGKYFNINGEAVLQVKKIDEEKCAILDPQGHNLGTVHKNYKLHACAAHCLLLQKQKEGK